MNPTAELVPLCPCDGIFFVGRVAEYLGKNSLCSMVLMFYLHFYIRGSKHKCFSLGIGCINIEGRYVHINGLVWTWHHPFCCL